MKTFDKREEVHLISNERERRETGRMDGERQDTQRRMKRVKRKIQE